MPSKQSTTHLGSVWGIEVLQRDLQDWLEIGIGFGRPLRHSLLAEIYAAAGKLDDALSEVAKGFAAAEATSECWWEAEMRRLSGNFILARDDDAMAAETYFRQSLEVARRQQAKSLELRADRGF